MRNQFVKLFRTNAHETLENQINDYLSRNPDLKIIQFTFASDCKLYSPEALILFEKAEPSQKSGSATTPLTNEAEIKLLDKIATYLENPMNWSRLKDCLLWGGHSDDLRKLLVEALSNT